MTDHILVIGYGDTGRHAVNAALAVQPDARMTVLDLDCVAAAEAWANGADAVVGDGRDTCALDDATADLADRVIIAVPDDLDAFLITRAVRPMNPDAVIVAVIREPANSPIFTFDGTLTVHLGRPDDGRT
ncbi:NAD-binding protein [Lentzea sp. CC55]|uniref:NAD-binding protein n=1 Tax=Lentzea sp. CC55 TaxID=2884909 RepID=UPI001F27C04C|nr:NAD-binding protein [Lentzea sp. CC55]MCG8926057.1 NAD-binding protein [Lentzea sp. CC55]